MIWFFDPLQWPWPIAVFGSNTLPSHDTHIYVIMFSSSEDMVWTSITVIYPCSDLDLGGTDLCAVHDTPPSHDTHIYEVSLNNVQWLKSYAPEKASWWTNEWMDGQTDKAATICSRNLFREHKKKAYIDMM